MGYGMRAVALVSEQPNHNVMRVEVVKRIKSEDVVYAGGKLITVALPPLSVGGVPWE